MIEFLNASLQYAMEGFWKFIGICFLLALVLNSIVMISTSFLSFLAIMLRGHQTVNNYTIVNGEKEKDGEKG